jgi:hypothetical protein
MNKVSSSKWQCTLNEVGYMSVMLLTKLRYKHNTAYDLELRLLLFCYILGSVNLVNFRGRRIFYSCVSDFLQNQYKFGLVSYKVKLYLTNMKRNLLSLILRNVVFRQYMSVIFVK